MSSSKRIPDAEWERHKAEIEKLYVKDDLKREDVMATMANRYGFHPSKEQYCRRFKKWGLSKNSTSNDWAIVAHKVRKRKSRGKDSAIYINGSMIPEKKARKEISRYTRSTWDEYSKKAASPVTPTDIAIFTPAEQHLRTISFQNIPWFSFQKQLEVDGTLAVGKIIDDSDTWTPGISIHTDSVYAAYTSLRGYSGDILKYGVEYGTIPKTPTISSMEAILMSDLDIDRNSTGQGVRALSSPSTDFELLQAAIYSWTNNKTAGGLLDQFLTWVADSSQRWVLRSIFSYKTPTTEILATNLLSRACAVDDIDLVQLILNVGTDASVRNVLQSALLSAIRGGSVRLVRLLIDGGAEINPRRRHNDRYIPLQVAITMAKCSEMLQLLLERGADVNDCDRLMQPTIDSRSIDSRSRPLLGLAVESGCKNVVQMLLKAGASLDRWDPRCGTALQIAAACDNMEIVDILVAHGCHVDAPLGSSMKPNYDTHMIPYHVNAYISPLVHATRNGNVSMVKALLDAGANPNPQLSKRRQLFLKEIASLSQYSRTDICHYTDTALQTAVRMKNYELMEILLSAGASVDRYQCGDSPLQIAVRLNDINLVKSLITYAAKIDAPADWPFGRTAVQAASENGSIDLLKLLLNKISDFWRIQSIDAPPSRVGGRTALQAAAEKGHIEVLTLLLELGANANGPSAERFGVTTLQAAVLSGSLTVANLVLAAGADTSTPHGTVSALTVAVNQDNMPMFELLLQLGLDVSSVPNKDSRSPLEVAAMQKSTVYLRKLIGAGADVNAWRTEASGATALYTAVDHGRLEATQLLLQAGAFPNLAVWPSRDVYDEDVKILPIDSELITLMHRYGPENMCIDGHHRRITLQEACDALNIPSDVMYDYLPSLENQYPICIDGSNALGIIIYRWLDFEESCADLFQLLISYGADVNSRVFSDCSAKSVLGHAAANGLKDAVRILLASGADVNWRFSPEDETVLASALSGEDDAILHMILDAGADINTISPCDFLLK